MSKAIKITAIRITITITITFSFKKNIKKDDNRITR